MNAVIMIRSLNGPKAMLLELQQKAFKKQQDMKMKLQQEEFNKKLALKLDIMELRKEKEAFKLHVAQDRAKSELEILKLKRDQLLNQVL